MKHRLQFPSEQLSCSHWEDLRPLMMPRGPVCGMGMVMFLSGFCTILVGIYCWISGTRSGAVVFPWKNLSPGIKVFIFHGSFPFWWTCVESRTMGQMYSGGKKFVTSFFIEKSCSVLSKFYCIYYSGTLLEH